MGAFGGSGHLVGLPLCRQLRRSIDQRQRGELVLRLSRLVLLDILSYKPTYGERPALPCAGLSFGGYSNGLFFVAQVIDLRGIVVIQRLSERLPHSPVITSAASSYRAHPVCRFVATAHLSTDQVNCWNKYSDTLVRYSRYICVNRRDKYSPYSAVCQLRVCRFISR